MSLLDHTPRFDAIAAAAIAREHYDVVGVATRLPSERDQNWLIETTAGTRFVLKVANRTEDRAVLEAQNAAMTLVASATGMAPRVVPAANGDAIVRHVAADGPYFIRLLTWIAGQPMGVARRRSFELLEDLGRRLGEVDRALASFDHPAIHRDFHWDLAAGVGTVQRHAHRIENAALRATVETTTRDTERELRPLIPELPRSAIHNDANDYNVIVADGGDTWTRRTRIAGLIDFGDIVHSYTVGDLAVALAYAVLKTPNPLAGAAVVARAYHLAHPLSEAEVAALFGLMRLRLCMSVALAAHQHRQRPDDEYLLVSQRPIERLLPALAGVPSGFAEATFRHACGIAAVPASRRIAASLGRSNAFVPTIAMDPTRTLALDLSVSSPLVPADPDLITEPAVTGAIDRAMRDAGATVGIGRYAEPRSLYSTPLFAPDDIGGERRMIHLGVDLFAPPGTSIRAPLDGVVHAAADNASPLDYGPVIILRHVGNGDEFYTLYGHVTRESLANMKVGRTIAAGESFAAVGTADVNGGWTPHLHFQIIIDPLGLDCDFPGVCRASELAVWQQFSPDPNLILRLEGGTYPVDAIDADRAVVERRERIGRNLSVGYRRPVKTVRGWKQYLYDAEGRRYLDAYNNVPHAGHSHPRIVRAVAEQLQILNTNTRYVYDMLARYAERLVATLPDPLRVCYFVNSGSEANELALRLARAHTGRRDVIVLEAGYHGNTTTLIEISPYKFNGPGGSGAPPWVHVVPVPDVYRGPYTASDSGAASKYAGHVASAIEALEATGPARLSAFIAETCPSVAGQIMLPSGYLGEVYEHIRRGGGVCIADEVQTAYGRIGTHFYAFEAHAVVPDIVVLGKPIGNGYPLGAVVTTPAIAASFDNGMEFFSTFGGSTVSCAAGLAVLDVVQDEKLQAHAERVGALLLGGLRALAARYETIGDVRGSGFFIGVELVTSRETLNPASTEAAFIVERMREEGILIGTDGPHHNVLKIRPPMPFDRADAERLVETLDGILAEIVL